MIPTYSYIGAVLLRQFSGGFKKEHSTEGCWSAGHWAVDPDLAHLKRLRPPKGRTKCRPRTNLEKEHLIPLVHHFSCCVFPFLKCTFNAASTWVHLKMICAPQYCHVNGKFENPLEFEVPFSRTKTSHYQEMRFPRLPRRRVTVLRVAQRSFSYEVGTHIWHGKISGDKSLILVQNSKL